MQRAEPFVDLAKFDHGCCRLAERFDCKTLLGILYQQRLFARIIGAFADLHDTLANSNPENIVYCYLMRHGEAVSEAPDGQRSLSAKGRVGVTEIAQRARSRGVSVARIYHSGILRAQQTAELVARVLLPREGVRKISGLRPDDDPFIIKVQADQFAQSVLLVSHLPYLDRLASLMTTGNSGRSVIDFAPATLACLTRHPNRWKLNWSLSVALAG
ncbi:MAG TPA: phosphohistidine phosphatase SixA [Candidatus Binatia bacterium]|nr:phosphohistidine phosphatase SixA [Candidatus Binatia bacterium]